VEPGPDRSSAETALHLLLTQRPGVGAVLHTHSVWATVLSERHGEAGGLSLAGFEMLKAFPGVTTHETDLWVPI
jgi:methylthioribulose-1-phosphate dehydratase